MRSYDPSKALDHEEWLALDESEQLDLVMEFHRSSGEYGESLDSHAAIHTAVETQLALEIPSVNAAFYRLRKQGLTRHDAVHAIGSVLFEFMQDCMGSDQTSTEDANEQYYERLSKFNAADWLDDT